MQTIKKFWGLRSKGRVKNAQEVNASYPSHIKVYRCDHFARKPEQRFPEEGWRLLARIGPVTPTAKPKDTYDFERHEDVLERIDLFACLLGSRRIE